MDLDQVLQTKLGPNYSSSEGPSVWLSVSGASDETYRKLGEKFNLHPLTIEDCQSTSERREKVEVFQDYTFFMFETTEGAREVKPDQRGQHDSTLIEPTISIRLLVFKNCILSFHPRGVPAIKTVKTKLEKVHGYHIPTTAWLVHAILDGIIDAMVPEVDNLLRGISEFESDFMAVHHPHKGHHHRHLRYEDYTLERKKDTHRQRLQRIAETRKKLLSLRQRVWPKRDILTTLINKDGAAFLSGVQMPYLRDVHDHLLTMSEKVERANDLLNAVQSNYLASISIQLSEQNETLNQVMKQLTGMATICLPLTLVTGLFGMNLPVPLHPEAATLKDMLLDPKLVPFYGVTIVICFSGIVFYGILKRNRMM
jgi:magnesium transporter